jgi:hypothetical protein
MPLAVLRRLLAGRTAAAGRSPGVRSMPTPSDLIAPPTCVPIVNLTVNPYPEGNLLRVNAHVTLKPPPDVQSRADAVGVPALRAEFAAKCRAAREVERWQVLRRQIETAEAAAARAEEAIAQADAAKALLERDLSPNLADELRRVQAEAAAAIVARDATAKDLDEVRHLIPRHFAPAATAIHGVALSTFTPHALKLSAARTEAEKQLKEAVAVATARIEQVLAEVLAPAAAALLVAHRADREAWEGGSERIRTEVRESLLGPTPTGVRQIGARFEVVAAPPAAPPAEPVEPDLAAPTRQQLGGVKAGM